MLICYSYQFRTFTLLYCFHVTHGPLGTMKSPREEMRYVLLLWHPIGKEKAKSGSTHPLINQSMQSLINQVLMFQMSLPLCCPTFINTRNPELKPTSGGQPFNMNLSVKAVASNPVQEHCKTALMSPLSICPTDKTDS